MRQLSRPMLLMRRLAEDWMLLLSVFIGFMIATTLGAAAPVYLSSLDRLAFSASLDRLNTPFLNINIFSSHVALTRNSMDEADRHVSGAIDRHMSRVHLDHNSYLRTGVYIVGLPTQPLPKPGATRLLVSRGFIQELSNLEQHSRFVEGRMAGSRVYSGPQGPELEAVISTATAENFQLQIDDIITITPSIGNPTILSARIVGILEPADPNEEYWSITRIFLDPAPLTDPPQRGVTVRPDEPPVALFVTRELMVEVVGEAYPGTLVEPIWFIQLDKQRFKGWNLSDIRRSVTEFEDEIIAAMPGTSVNFGVVRGFIEQIDQRGVFSRIPLILLIAVMTVTVLFFLAMMVSYLVQSRERDAALLRTRGVGTLQFMRLYALEGVVMTVVAVALAPFLAMGMVAMAGKLWYFRDLTGGGMLPVEISLVPFVVSAGAGLLCLSIFVIPGVVGARGGLLAHKLRSSRPPTSSLFHRYYVDVALLAVGGLVYWELRSRGSFISGGLFKGLEVDETLLVAPVLFMVVVALVFMRFFPLLVRFVSGESAALVDLLVVGTVLVLGAGIGVREVQEGNGGGWLGAEALLVSVYGVYWATNRIRGLTLRVGGLVIQGVLVGWFLFLEPPASGEVLFVPTIALISVVPAQVVYLLLAAFTKRMPVWLLMGLWHMARNPLQYTWLVLLLVLVTGAAILSTTVGGTLERSQQDQVQYEVAADLRISRVSRFLAGGIRGIKERFLDTQGVAAASIALRTTGSVGALNVQVLAMESQQFPYVSWYRDDFSERPMSEVMGSLQPRAGGERVAIPDGADRLGVWVKPLKIIPLMSIWMVVQDSAGTMRTLTLGDLGPTEWHLHEADIPRDLVPPLYLVSVQVFEPGQGSVLTSGVILLDDIHAVVGDDGEEVILEDFESQNRWLPIPTSPVSLDRILASADSAYRGQKAGLFAFGPTSNKSVRGFYQSAFGGKVPVVASSSLLAASGHDVGDSFVANIAGRLTPVVVQDAVEFFPTMSPKGGFLLADLDVLLGYVNMMGQLSMVQPNELYIKRAKGGDEAVDALADELAAKFVAVEDVSSRLAFVRLDSLAITGWRAMVLLSLAIVLLAAAVGYESYLLLYKHRSRREVGFLQSMGLSRLQLMGLLGFEHMSIVAVGLGLGTWAGFQMSGLIVSQLAITETGESVVPPFVLQMDWDLMFPTYVVLIGVFMAAQFMLNRTISRLDLQAIARLSE